MSRLDRPPTPTLIAAPRSAILVVLLALVLLCLPWRIGTRPLGASLVAVAAMRGWRMGSRVLHLARGLTRRDVRVRR